MGIEEIVLLGVALSFDAFSVTISDMFVYPHESRTRLLALPVAFGAFQGIMPVFGYFLSGVAAELIERYAGIVAFVILGIIGGNMLREGIAALRSGEASTERSGEHITLPLVLFQAVATAIDAFAVGIELRAAQAPIALAAGIIAATTLLLCLVALAVGRAAGERLGDRAEVVGGAVLVLIGLKQLLF